MPTVAYVIEVTFFPLKARFFLLDKRIFEGGKNGRKKWDGNAYLGYHAVWQEVLSLVVAGVFLQDRTR